MDREAGPGEIEAPRNEGRIPAEQTCEARAQRYGLGIGGVRLEVTEIQIAGEIDDGPTREDDEREPPPRPISLFEPPIEGEEREQRTDVIDALDAGYGRQQHDGREAVADL